MTTMTTSEFKNGTQVRIKPGKGELGTYRVFRGEPREDGSILVYGGDADPSGYRAFRDFRVANLMEENRPEILRKLRRQSHD